MTAHDDVAHEHPPVRAAGLSAKATGRIFVFQVAMNILVLSFIIMQLILATSRIQKLQDAQIHYIQDQNTLQICGQREMLVALRSIGRKLGLPVEDIVAPYVDVELCEFLASQVTTPPTEGESP